ncbi:UNVERIFIED_CONTAM: Alkane hydroxylase MAH1 [Sesamum latifolium]|uniref:Alkane hydroxylase MAH1 n=1 Tax=Sesamum latifolium TaxID=2727402 RepID=A0AAW2WN22_9LAMI
MVIFEHLEFFLIVLLIIYLYYLINRRGKKSHEPTDWPVLRMLPAVLQNFNRIHDYATEVLIECGGTFMFKGPWSSNTDMLFTCDPANIHHVFSRNFSNYPKGPEFRKIFEVLGDGIFNADFELWEIHRRTTLSLLTHSKFHSSLERTVWGRWIPGSFLFLPPSVNRELKLICKIFSKGLLSIISARLCWIMIPAACALNCLTFLARRRSVIRWNPCCFDT